MSPSLPVIAVLDDQEPPGLRSALDGLAQVYSTHIPPTNTAVLLFRGDSPSMEGALRLIRSRSELSAVPVLAWTPDPVTPLQLERCRRRGVRHLVSADQLSIILKRHIAQHSPAHEALAEPEAPAGAAAEVAPEPDSSTISDLRAAAPATASLHPEAALTEPPAAAPDPAPALEDSPTEPPQPAEALTEPEPPAPAQDAALPTPGAALPTLRGPLDTEARFILQWLMGVVPYVQRRNELWEKLGEDATVFWFEVCHLRDRARTTTFGLEPPSNFSLGRSGFRADVDHPIRFAGEDEAAGQLVNVGTDGLCVALEEPTQPGRVFDFEIWLQGQRAVSLSARGKWQKRTGRQRWLVGAILLNAEFHIDYEATLKGSH